jgi:UDPglucose 6-dehydrogenase
MEADLLEAVEAVNTRQLGKLQSKLESRLGADLRGRQLAIWGLAFKAGTDDMRDSPAIPLIEGLLRSGADVCAHDPHAAKQAERIFGSRITLREDPYEAAKAADALIVVTDWMVYRTPNFDRLRAALRRPLIVDGRNLYDPERMARSGFEYLGIGTGQS